MENQHTQFKPPPLSDRSSPPHSSRDSGGHISLSPPLGSPPNSAVDSVGHISLSPTLGSPQNSEHLSLSPPVGSPCRSSLSSDDLNSRKTSPENKKTHSPEKKPPPPPPPPVVINKYAHREPADVVSRVVLDEHLAIVKRAELEEPKDADIKTDPAGGGAGPGGARMSFKRPSLSILRKPRTDKVVRRAALGFRVFGFLFCLVSFSVMAADRNQGWAVDSFERYKEFSYCMSVNVIGFVYSGAQAFDLSYNLATGKSIVQHQQQLRHYFDFALDQMIAYLLISASSSGAIRIDDWQSNWGKDKFPDMATASISMSFLAFVALAASSLISGYSLCTSKSM